MKKKRLRLPMQTNGFFFHFLHNQKQWNTHLLILTYEKCMDACKNSVLFLFNRNRKTIRSFNNSIHLARYKWYIWIYLNSCKNENKEKKEKKKIEKKECVLQTTESSHSFIHSEYLIFFSACTAPLYVYFERKKTNHMHTNFSRNG